MGWGRKLANELITDSLSPVERGGVGTELANELITDSLSLVLRGLVPNARGDSRGGAMVKAPLYTLVKRVVAWGEEGMGWDGVTNAVQVDSPLTC